MDQDRRNPIRTFDPSLISCFLEGREVTSARLLDGGKSNSNYKLTLSDGLVCVLRLMNNSDTTSELEAMKLASELVPVPKILSQGEGWRVSEHMPGVPLSEAPEGLRAAARALARISCLKLASSGELGVGGDILPFEFGGIAGYIELQLSNPEVIRRLTSPRVDRLQALLVREQQRLKDIDGDHYLVHGDFNPNNILIENGEVSAVLDWEFAHSGTFYMDIGNLLRHTSKHSYSELKTGLRSGGAELPSDWIERAELVDLCSQLEFLSSTRSDTFKSTCIDRIESLLEYYSL